MQEYSEIAPPLAGPRYAPDILPKIRVEARDRRLSAVFTDSQPNILAHGEKIECVLQVENVGTQPIGEVWLVHGDSDEIWLGKDEKTPGRFCTYI